MIKRSGKFRRKWGIYQMERYYYRKDAETLFYSAASLCLCG